MVSDIKGGTLTESFYEQGAEEDIWNRERKSGRRLEENS
jgi:hypothetical protein